MNITDCINFSNENPICFVATVEGDQPRVRALGFWFADETGFYFQTSSAKQIAVQVKKDPKVEVCFYNPEIKLGTMLRIAGKAELVYDAKIKAMAITDQPFHKRFGLTIDSPGLIVFKIAHGQAHFWKIEDNLKPKQYIEF